MTILETLLARTLRTGVVVSTGLLAAGMCLSLASPGPVANLLLQTGLIVLMGTPMARVLISCAEYVRERDWFFAFNAFGVLVVLAVTIWHAMRG